MHCRDVACNVPTVVCRHENYCKQRWLIIESAEGQKSNIQKLNSKIEQEKNPALKLVKKLETTGFDTVTQAQNYLKSINKKLKLWEEQIFRNQV